MDLSKKPDLIWWLHHLVLGTLAVAILVLVVASWRLLYDYRPGPLGDPRLADGYRIATRTLIAVGTVLVVLRATIWRQRGRRGAVPIGFAVGGTLLIGISAFTFGQLLWDQLALAAVTVGTDTTGLTAVLSEDIVFVLVDGQEVSEGAYTAMFVLHSLLTVIGTAAIAAAALWPVRPRTAPADGDPPGRGRTPSRGRARTGSTPTDGAMAEGEMADYAPSDDRTARTGAATERAS